MEQQRALAGPFTPTDDDLSRCVRCGFCLPHCPTYVETGLEAESPRGRLYIIKALADGLIEPTPAALGHLDMCLQCRNCEAVCPSGVPYGHIMEGARAEVLRTERAPLSWKLRALFLREIVARPTRLRAVALGLRLYQRSGLRDLVERIPMLRDCAILAPAIHERWFRETGLIARPQGPTRMRVGLLSGCIMPLAYGRVHRATARALAGNGCEVIVPAAQVCCGALHAHNGDRRTAVELARRNVDAFLDAGVDAVVVNSAGCGAVMKEYGQLLAEDPRYRDSAKRFASLVWDVNEFLAALPFQPPRSRLTIRVTYQDSCHLAHAQRIAEAPRQILKSIPSLELVEMEHADRCCGSAGVYSLTQATMSLALLNSKMAEFQRTGAQYLATANPGCMTHLEAGLRRHRLPGRVVHVVELLDRAYRASVPRQGAE
jgi:glycolate oxidase iron-sulfur subunit